MSKILLGFSVLAIFGVRMALAQTFDAQGLHFVAPGVEGKGNIYSPEIGEIVFDHSDGHFYGYDSVTPWVDMNAVSGTLTASDELSNVGIATSVGSNALTIALKQSNGTDPSSGSSAVKIGFRNSTAATGQYVQRSVTSALSMTVSSGSTLGTLSSVSSYLYVYAIDNSGTVELAISSQLYDSGSILSTTAEGGAGAADSYNVIYSTTARSNVPARLIGRLKITETSAGLWASNATEISLQPFSKGEVTSSNTSLERIERVKIANNGSVSISSQSGNWVSSVTRNGAGDVTVTIASGIFSATPTCSVTPIIGSTTGGSTWIQSESSTSVRVNTTQGGFFAGNATDVNFNLVCMGPR